jgi:hypothetical protein
MELIYRVKGRDATPPAATRIVDDTLLAPSCVRLLPNTPGLISWEVLQRGASEKETENESNGSWSEHRSGGDGNCRM